MAAQKVGSRFFGLFLFKISLLFAFENKHYIECLIPISSLDGQLAARILTVTVSPDQPAQYVAVMNTILEAKKQVCLE